MAGASFDIWPDPVETLPLTKIYRRRAHLSHRMNRMYQIESIDFDADYARENGREYRNFSDSPVRVFL